ncbi:MAG: NAD-dependent epimerase/dehydratase family protein, partial [Candidatus Rokuibacteriota bacterium]
MITILGGSGFVGSHLVRRLRETGAAHRAPARGEPLGPESLGTVIYCIGLTADFRDRPLATVDAHVSQLTETLRHAEFERVVYLSSTRVYRRSRGPCAESDVLHLDPGDPDDLYG